MALVKLKSREQDTLRRIARSSSDGREVRRAQALLWLDDGDSIAQVSERLGLSRQAIYDQVERYHNRNGQPVHKRVCDVRHPGRPSKKKKLAMEVAEPLLDQDPREYGYRSPVWTVPILCREVERHTQEKVSTRTMRRALHALSCRYKRPRYALARRPATWRQAKGGSNAA